MGAQGSQKEEEEGKNIKKENITYKIFTFLKVHYHLVELFTTKDIAKLEIFLKVHDEN